jgi:hypothetical protein
LGSLVTRVVALHEILVTPPIPVQPLDKGVVFDLPSSGKDGIPSPTSIAKEVIPNSSRPAIC